MLNRKICVAPMMDWTDQYDRYFLRLVAPHVFLYTEMVTTGALIHGDAHRFLNFHPCEHPVALQIGGSDPNALAHCAKLAEKYGYDEINLNVGCPSSRVQSGKFGACLMKVPGLVAECILAMKRVVTIPVTIKCRIGVDQDDSYEFLHHFIEKNAAAGCQVFIIHARKAWLNGLSPKQNREIPPLQYNIVHKIKKDFPELNIIINGGMTSLGQVQTHLQHVDGVMIGREAYTNPYFLAEIEREIFNTSIKSRSEIIEQFIPYVEKKLQEGVRLASMTRHILGLYQGEKGARMWRRYLSENANKNGAGIEVITEALNRVARGDHREDNVNAATM